MRDGGATAGAGDTGADGQGALLPESAELRQARRTAQRATAAARRREVSQPTEPAATDPVARVLVDVPLAHLDRPFDYLVPADLDDRVVPGCRVRVRFAGQDVDGFVLERVATSDHPGRLAPLRRAVSAEPVLTPEVARLTARVAERYAGTRSDVLRLAVPPRHAAVEKRDVSGDPVPDPLGAVALDDARRWWARVPDGSRFVDAAARDASADPSGSGPDDLGSDEPGPRAVWTVAPGDDWAEGLAHAAAVTLAAGRGSVLCVPDGRDLAHLDAVLGRVLGEGRHVCLSADLGPAKRYRAFLSVARGRVRVVAGTRAAAFAPVHDLGLVGTWDDGDDLHAEPRAPYPHAREVLLLRAHDTGAAALLAGHARSVEAQALVTTGWAGALAPDRTALRRQAPRVSVTGEREVELERDPTARAARVPRTAHELVREALVRGPVLVQVPRAGYAASLTCERCRTPARCRTCGGPLVIGRAGGPPTCARCGASEPAHACVVCGGTAVRAPVVGDRRTAEELGRAFPQVPVRRSSGEHVLDGVGPEPAIVVATPGAEPAADGGYAGVLLLDTWLLLARADLRAAEEAARRWFNAAALARSATDGGRVLAVGEPGEPALQALVRWDPAGLAAREAEDRAAAHLPPASRTAVVSGPEVAVEEVLAALRAVPLPAGAEVLGPSPLPSAPPQAAPGPPSGAASRPVEEIPGAAPAAPGAPEAGPAVRVVVRVPRASGAALSRSLREVQGVRSARKLPPVRVQVDPWALG